MLNPWLRMRNGFCPQRRLMLALMASLLGHLLLLDGARQVSPLPGSPAPLSARLQAQHSPPPVLLPDPISSDAAQPRRLARASESPPVPASQTALTPAPGPSADAEPAWRALSLEESLVMYRLNLWRCLQGEDMPMLSEAGVSLQIVQQADGELQQQVLHGTGDVQLDHRWLSLLAVVQARCALPEGLQGRGFALLLEFRP